MGRKNWTDEEIKIAINMKNNGKSNKEIGLYLNRNPNVVYNKLSKLGVSKPIKSKNHFYKVGEVVNGNLKILEQVRDKNGKSYIVKSTNFPNESSYTVTESSLKGGHGCAYSSGRKATKDNSLWNIESVRGNITNVEEAKITTPYSNKKLLFKCSSKNCKYNKMTVVSSVVKHGFSCPNCSTGISYPERFMLAVNEYYKLGFDYQKSYKKGIFDFINYTTKVVVEMNGKQHYDNVHVWKESYEKTRLSDNKKREWCKENGYTLIFINARKSEFEFIKNSINQCEYLPNIKIEDYDKILEIIESYSKYDVQDIINSYVINKSTTSEIATDIGVSSVTISNILKRNNIKLREGNTRPIKCLDTDITYSSGCEAMRKTGINQRNISSACRGKRKTAGGYRWEYVN